MNKFYNRKTFSFITYLVSTSKFLIVIESFLTINILRILGGRYYFLTINKFVVDIFNGDFLQSTGYTKQLTDAVNKDFSVIKFQYDL